LKIDQDKLIGDFKELIRSPALERILFHKVRELALLHSSEVDHVSKLYRLIDDGVEASKLKRTVLFEMEKKESEWRLDTMGDNFEVPDVIVQYIAERAERYGTLERGLNFPGCDDTTFNLGYEKEDCNYISGIIEIVPKYPSIMENGGLSKMEAVKFKVIIRLMLEFPDIRKLIFNEFDEKWLPLLEYSASAE